MPPREVAARTVDAAVVEAGSDAAEGEGASEMAEVSTRSRPGACIAMWHSATWVGARQMLSWGGLAPRRRLRAWVRLKGEASGEAEAQ